MDEEFMADNATTEYVEDYTTTGEIVEDSAAAVEEVGTVEDGENAQSNLDTETPPAVAANNSDVSDVTKTKAFSERLNAAVKKRSDEIVASMGFTNTYTGKPIRTQDEFEAFKRMHEAAQQGRDPIVTAELSGLKQQLQTFTIKEQDQQLLNDPDYSEIYKEVREDVMALVEDCRRRNVGNVDVRAAFSAVITNGKTLNSIIARQKEKAEKEALRKVQANAGASVGALGDGASNSPMSINNMSDDAFERMVADVKNGKRVIFGGK